MILIRRFESFCTINNLKCFIKEPICFKDPDINPTYLDSCRKNFQEPSALETGLSDFQKIVLCLNLKSLTVLLRWLHIENMITFIDITLKVHYCRFEISLYVLINLKIIPSKFGIFNPKNSRVIHP